MIQSVNLNHTYLNTTLWAFRKGCFCSKKTHKKTVETILLTGFELTNPDWGNRFHTQSFFGHTGTYICCVLEWNWRGPTMVLGALRKLFRIQSILLGLKYTSQSGLMAFDKSCSKTFGFIIWAPITIQWYKNTSGYDNDYPSPAMKTLSTSSSYLV